MADGQHPPEFRDRADGRAKWRVGTLLVASLVLYSSTHRSLSPSPSRSDRAPGPEGIARSLQAPPPCGPPSSSPRMPMWSAECTEWYNDGGWSLRAAPVHAMPFHQAFGYHYWTNRNCKRVGKLAAFQSPNFDPPSFTEEAFINAALRISEMKAAASLPRETVVSFVGDSVTRQSFAVLLELAGMRREDCEMEVLGDKGFLFASECNRTFVDPLGRSATLSVRMHNSNYGTDGWHHEPFFAQADVALVNFGVWYVEQKALGRETNHTSRTYLPRMVRLIEEIDALRRPNQLIVFRETSASWHERESDIMARLIRELHPVLIQHRIPLVTRHSSNDPAAIESRFYRDDIHFCEPSVPLAWLTVLTRMMSDWVG